MSELEQRIAQLEINVLRAQAELAQAKLEAATAHLPKPYAVGDFVVLAREVNSRLLRPAASA